MKNNLVGKRIAISIALCFFCLFGGSVLAQTDSLSNVSNAVSDCEASLNIANTEFNAGRFFSLPSILKDCLDKGFTKEQKIRAYILLCQVYLINDNPQEAENSYLKLLQADPEYIASPALDPIDVVYLSQKFTTRPVFTPNFKLGIGTSFTSLIYSLNPSTEGTSTESSLRLGSLIGGGIDWNMSDRLATCLDFTLSTYSFKKEISNVYDGDVGTSIARLTWLDIPLFIKYQDQYGKWRPFFYAGYAIHLRLSSKYDFTYENFITGNSYTTEGAGEDFSSRQNLMNRSIVFGGGMKYKIGKNFLFADLRLNVGLSNLTKESTNVSFENNDATRFNFISDYYRLNSAQLMVGYIIPYYNPRKKGDWQPKGLLGKILYGKNALQE